MLSLMPKIAAAQEPPKFLIEAIRVAGVQRAAARQIVADESLLKPGQTYSEQQLRQAIYRVKRLPFVVAAEFSLEKGSARGAYELVIKVEEAKPLFFLADVWGRSTRYNFSGRRGSETHWQEDGSVGGRYFVGNHGLVFGSVQKSEGQDGELLQGGYTQYNLFGAGSFASAGVTSTVGIDHQKNLQGSLTAGLPLTAVQSLRGSVYWYQAESTERFPFFGDGSVSQTGRRQEGWTSGLSWIFDSTDDPLFPSSGLKMLAGGGYSQDESSLRLTPPVEGIDLTQSSSSWTIDLFGRRHWAVTPRQSVSLALDVSRNRYSSDDGYTNTDLRGFAAVGYALDLLGFGADGHRGDLRFESEIGGDYSDVSNSYADGSARSAYLLATLSYRTSWGVARLSFRYEDLGSRL